jgi:twinkle protein
MKKENTSISEIEKRLLVSLRTTLSQLYPNGRVEGKEFSIGNVEGDAGASLKINLSTGLWADFAAGPKGRILKFFAYRNGNDFVKGLDEVRKILKLPPVPASNKYKRPPKDWLEDVDYDSKPIKYLTKVRGIPRAILSACKVRTKDNAYIFLGHDEDNKLCYAQYTERMSNGEKKVTFSKKSKLPLWGMHTMRSLATDGHVIITEGVIDAMTFRSAGMYAVSIPSGINNTDWIEHSWNWLSQFETIYLCLDYDEAGQANISEIAGRLGIYRCKKVILPCKDANEVMLTHKDTWVQLLKEALKDANDFSPEKRVRPVDIKDRVVQAIQEGPIKDQGDLLLGWYFEPSALVKKPLNFRIRPHEYTIWSGYPGGGKSTILFQLAAYNIFVLGQKVAIASLEEPVEKVIIKMLTQALGKFPELDTKEFEKAYKILDEHLIVFNELGISPLDEILEFFEFAVKKDGVKHCILDSMMCTDIDVDGDKAQVNEKIKQIIQSLNTTKAHYHIVAHCTKGDDEDFGTIPKLRDIKGIQEIAARAHNVIIVWRNKIKEGSLEKTIHDRNHDSDFKVTEIERKQRDQFDAIIKVAKNRNGKSCGQIRVWFDQDTDRYRPCPEITGDIAYLDSVTESQDKDNRPY